MAQPAPAVDPQVQAALEERKQQQCAQRWIAELTLSEKAQRKWLDRAKKITRLYKRENSMDETARKFAMLWSNVETVKPAVYSRPPQPVVARRFSDPDPVGRAVSEVLERSLVASIDLQDMDSVLKLARDDLVLVGRAQAWERYEPTFGPEVIPEIALQVVTGGDEDEGSEVSYADEAGEPYEGDVTERDGAFFGQGEPYKPVTYEESITDYVNYDDFGHSVARTWGEVWYVWRRVYLTREALIKRFGEDIGKRIPLDWGPVQRGKNDDESGLQKKAAIYEIWDKTAKEAIWISTSWPNGPLDRRDDPLGIDGFFPCPKPLLATTANDSVIPVPDYVFYQDQAEEIDVLTDRIAVLQKALKVRGFYAAAEKTNLNALFNSETNILIPVPDWQTMKEGGGVRGNIEWFPIENVVAALKAMIEQRALLIQDVYQITGIADILRGANDPRATATAEGIKEVWGTLRIRDKQNEVVRFARDMLRIKSQVISAKFDIETLKAMTQVRLPTNDEKAQVQAQIQQMQAQAQQQALIAQAQAAQQPPGPPQGPPGAPPGMMGHNGGPPMPQPPEIPEEMQAVLRSPSWEDVIAMMRDDAARQFRIDVETDSTIEPNEAEQKAQIVELLTASSAFISQWGPVIAAQPAIAPMAGALFKAAVRRFRAGRELEDVIDSTIDNLQKIAAQPAGAAAAPPPDKTPVEVASINLERERVHQEGEKQRALMDAQVAAGEQNLRAQDNQLKVLIGGRDQTPQVNV